MISNLKDALASFPSGLVVATTRAPDGAPRGFTASSFCSVSLQPPLVSVCLAQKAECFDAFVNAERLNINILGRGHHEVATRFATRGADKFAGLDWSDDAWSIPVLADAVATLSCRLDRAIACGDHHLLLGAVEEVDICDQAESIVYYRRGFWSVSKDPQPRVPA